MVSTSKRVKYPICSGIGPDKKFELRSKCERKIPIQEIIGKFHVCEAVHLTQDQWNASIEAVGTQVQHDNFKEQSCVLNSSVKLLGVGGESNVILPALLQLTPGQLQRKALEEGMKLFISDNKVILTEGFDGVVPPNTKDLDVGVVQNLYPCMMHLICTNIPNKRYRDSNSRPIWETMLFEIDGFSEV
ncbi:hypothetical protein Ahy_A02g006323 [Arachis hypogaea]|uniref:Uncharacterized protein n=1 Tax=Arachis hypogaea TaxID=3818 RepID=A0A445E9L3_ARAHY|nr:hypothetical protein Ahy_A02g006323 [Arachis hypogaea]